MIIKRPWSQPQPVPDHEWPRFRRSRGQARLQAELDALRAQSAEGKAEPEATSAQETAKIPEPAPVNSGEAIDPVPTQEVSS